MRRVWWYSSLPWLGSGLLNQFFNSSAFSGSLSCILHSSVHIISLNPSSFWDSPTCPLQPLPFYSSPLWVDSMHCPEMSSQGRSCTLAQSLVSCYSPIHCTYINIHVSNINNQTPPSHDKGLANMSHCGICVTVIVLNIHIYSTTKKTLICHILLLVRQCSLNTDIGNRNRFMTFQKMNCRIQVQHGIGYNYRVKLHFVVQEIAS